MRAIAVCEAGGGAAEHVSGRDAVRLQLPVSASGLPAASGKANDGGTYTTPLGTEVRAQLQLGRGLQLHVVQDGAAAAVPLRMARSSNR